MSYFIFNNIKSSDMKIHIEHLPPIIKPPERYELTRVDGNSVIGIHELGYDVYEKTVPIGLKEADIEQVMNWLRGKGKIVFSNELDKYYDVYIPAQIDYEKALKFRKANITFLTQPYKHARNEDETTSLVVFNRGNAESLPLMTIYGSGAVSISINGVLSCTLNINEFITIDSEAQEAYKGTTLQNRSMIGKFPKFKPGINTITYTGSVSQIKTLVRSRWV